MQEGRDYSLLFRQLETAITEQELLVTSESIKLCQEIDPNIQELVKYIECVNQPLPGVYSGI